MTSRGYSIKLFFLTLFLGLLPALVLADGLVPCGGRGEDTCTLCHLLVGIDGLIKTIRNLSFVIAIVAITIAGTMYVVSAGTSLMEQAKKFLSATLTGFVIIFAAWLMVHTAIWIFAVKSDLGTEMGVNWFTFTCDKASSTIIDGGGPEPKAGQCAVTNNGCGGLSSLDSCKFTSPELATKLACLKSKGVGAIVTSIALNKSDWCEKCVYSYSGSTYCAHSQYSCHFGGRSCQGISQAVDLAPSEAVAKAAKECGFETIYYNNKEWVSGQIGSYGHVDHIHASVNNSQCNCK